MCDLISDVVSCCLKLRYR